MEYSERELVRRVRDLEVSSYQLQRKMIDAGLSINKAYEAVGKNVQTEEDADTYGISADDFTPAYFEAGLILYLVIWSFRESMSGIIMMITVPLIFACSAGLLLGMFANRTTTAGERRRNKWFRITSLLFAAVFLASAGMQKESEFNLMILPCIAVLLVQVIGFIRTTEKRNAETIAANIASNKRNAEEYEQRKKKAHETNARMKREIYADRQQRDRIEEQLNELYAEYPLCEQYRGSCCAWIVIDEHCSAGSSLEEVMNLPSLTEEIRKASQFPAKTIERIR